MRKLPSTQVTEISLICKCDSSVVPRSHSFVVFRIDCFRCYQFNVQKMGKNKLLAHFELIGILILLLVLVLGVSP